jgi:hypothetical protein
MKQELKSSILVQLDELIERFKSIVENPNIADESTFLSLCESAIERVSGTSSTYSTRLKEEKSKPKISRKDSIYHIHNVLVIMKALREEVSKDYLLSIESIINSHLFANFLEMAEHLLEENYKDLAAVIIGSTLEEHLRNLASKYSIPLENIDLRGSSKPKKADAINSDLTSANAYSKLDQKSVTCLAGSTKQSCSREISRIHKKSSCPLTPICSRFHRA